MYLGLNTPSFVLFFFLSMVPLIVCPFGVAPAAESSLAQGRALWAPS